MAYVFEHLIIEQEGDDKPDIEIFLNDENQIFINERDEDSPFWFTFSKEDWNEIKRFVDKQFGI